MAARRSFIRIGVIVVSALSLAACTTNAAGRGERGTHHPSSTSSTTTSTSSSSTSSSTSSTTSTSTTVALGGCIPSDLSLSSGHTGAATGTIYLGFTLSNSGHSPCTLDGYPTVVLLGPSGDVAAQVSHSGQAEIFSKAPSSVTLQPGTAAAAGFVVAYSDVQSNGQTSCPQVDGLELTMPGGGESFRVTRRFYPCGAPNISVSPIVSSGTYKSEVAS